MYWSASKHSLKFVCRFAKHGAVTRAGRCTCPGLGSAAAGAALLLGAQKSPLLSAEAAAAAVESPGNMQQSALKTEEKTSQWFSFQEITLIQKSTNFSLTQAELPSTTE